jgi:transposase
MLPNDLPPWHAVYEQGQRWIKAGVSEDTAHDLREVLRISWGRGLSFGSLSGQRYPAVPS